MNPLSISPSALAPFAEPELQRLANVLVATPEADQLAALNDDALGVEAAKAVGDARALIGLLHAVWGAEATPGDETVKQPGAGEASTGTDPSDDRAAA